MWGLEGGGDSARFGSYLVEEREKGAASENPVAIAIPPQYSFFVAQCICTLKGESTLTRALDYKTH